MVAVPAVTPVTTPVLEFTVATDGVLLLHVPPASASVNVIVVLAQKEDVPPEIAGACGHQRKITPLAGGAQVELKLVLVNVDVPSGKV